AAYPFCFAFAYGAFKNKNSMLIRCPRERGITFVIKKSPLSLTARFKNILKGALSNIKVFAIEESNVLIVPNQALSRCSPDKGAYFNLSGRFDYICPAAFASIFPHIFYDIKNDIHNADNRIAACPDHIVDQKFEFTARPESDKRSECGCCDFSKFTLSIKKGDRDSEDKFYMSEILKACNFKCFSAFAAIFPYYLTLAEGGLLGFYTNNRNSAIVQCPNTRGKVEFLIFKDPVTGKIFYKVLKAAGSCPMGHEKGDEFEIYKHPDIAGHILHIAYLYSAYLLQDPAHKPVQFYDTVGDESSVYTLSIEKY
ncbi:MAG: hypothetical protein ABH843_07260, partial [Candidatus Omnitrophota bacterium]